MKILVACTQYPYYGGAATNAYALIKTLRERGHDVCGLFFENSNANCDPDAIGCIIRSQAGKEGRNLLCKKIKVILGGMPDAILAKNYAAPVYCRKLFPKTKIVYLVSGSPLMTHLSELDISAVKYLKLNTSQVEKKIKKKIYNSSELSAIKCSNFVLTNSRVSRDVFVKTYSTYLKNKKVLSPLDTSILINNNSKRKKNFNERDVDIAFICSRFSRSVKNAKFAKKIFRDKSLAGKSKLIIGAESNSFANIPGIMIKDKMKHANIMKYLLRVKLVICPSYFDASPNVIKEATFSGCNILVSRNCGWSETYDAKSVCADVYDAKEWIRKIEYLCKNKLNYPNINNKKNILDRIENICKRGVE